MRLLRISNIGNVPGQNFQAVPFKNCRCVFYENWLRSSGGQAMGVQGVHYFSQLEFFFFCSCYAVANYILEANIEARSGWPLPKPALSDSFLEFMSIPRRPSTTAKIVL